VPGALETAMLAFERRPGVLYCNTYLLKTPEYVLVIDPGSDEADAQATAQTAQDLMRELPRQAAVCLTHCHLDHCAAAGTIIQACRPEVTVVCHRDTANALRGRDPELTLAKLTALDFPELHDVYPLFSGPGPQGVSRDMNTPGGGLRSLSIPIGPRDTLQAYHTPGHSPDSVCFRVGGALFAGDLPFAAGPGLITLPGWDAEQLEASLEKILWLLDHCNITTIYPGHGRPLDRVEARRVIADMLDELHRRVYHLPHGDKSFPSALLRAYSSLLDEAGVGAETTGAKAPEPSPSPLEIEQPPSAHIQHTEAALVAHRLDRMMREDSATPPALRLMHRARRRLGDFLCSLHGFRFADHAGTMELNQTIAELLQVLPGLPGFAGIGFFFNHVASAPVVRMDAEVLIDLVETALEALVEAGARRANVAVTQAQNTAQVTIAVQQGPFTLSGTIQAYLRLSMENYGCTFSLGQDSCTFIMPLIGDYS